MKTIQEQDTAIRVRNAVVNSAVAFVKSGRVTIAEAAQIAGVSVADVERAIDAAECLDAGADAPIVNHYNRDTINQIKW